MIHERFARGHLARYNGFLMKHLLWGVLFLQVLAQQPPKPGINLFSLQQDISPCWKSPKTLGNDSRPFSM